MSLPMEGVNDRKVFVLASDEDQGVVDKLQLGSKLIDLGFNPTFFYNMDPACRRESEFDKVGACLFVLCVLSENLFRDSYLEFCRKRSSTKCLVHLIISEKIQIASQDPAEEASSCVDEKASIEELPIEIRVFPCITVRDENWMEKLEKHLDTGPLRTCPAVGPIAPGLCCGYVYGYLEMVLPDFEKNIEEWWESAKIDESGAIMVKKMLNLIPKSCNCDTYIDAYGGENIRPLETKIRCRKTYLDTQERNFDLPVYRVQNPRNPDEIFYVVLVHNATVHTLYEMAADNTLDHDTMIRERSLFEMQLEDMMRDRPISIVSFDDRASQDNLTDLIIKKCKET